MNNKTLSDLFDLSSKTIVVTGGTGILGGEMAVALTGLGANVAILDRNTNLPDGLKSKLDKGPGKYQVVYADVLDRTIMEQARIDVDASFGPVDVLINAAGGNHPDATTGTGKAFFDLPKEALSFGLDLNVLGTMLPSQVFGMGMAEQGHGNILNISSMSAYQPLTRIPAYSAAKAGVNNFTQWLAVHMALEYSPNIRVNALAPGFFLTEQNRFLLTDEATGEMTPRGQTIIDHTPQGRFGDPGDLLGAMIWLLSPASAFVTGIVVPVDGGFSAFSGV